MTTPVNPFAYDIERATGAIESEQTATCWDRTWRRLHWSHLCLGTAAVTTSTVGLGYAAFAYVSQEYFGAAVATGIVACNVSAHLLAAICIYRFKPLKSFENRVIELGRKNKDFALEVRLLKEEIAQLAHTKEELQKLFNESQDNIKKIKHMLEQRTTELATVAAQLKQTQEQFIQMKSCFEDFKKENSSLLSRLEVFKQLYGKLHSSVAQVEQQNDQMGAHANQIAEGISNISRESQDFAELVRDLTPMMNQFSERVGDLDEQFESIERKMGQLQEYVTKLDEADDKYRDGANRLADDVVPGLRQVAEDLNEALRQAKEMVDSLTSVDADSDLSERLRRLEANNVSTNVSSAADFSEDSGGNV